MKNHKTRYALLLLPLLVSACQSVPPTVAEHPGFIKGDKEGDRQGIDDTHPRARLVVSRKLIGHVRMANLKFRKVGRFTQAQVGIQNLSADRYNAEYRVEWEDKDGFMVDQSGVWRRITLAPYQINTFTTVGKKPEAEKIVVNLRLPDDPFIINKDEDKK